MTKTSLLSLASLLTLTLAACGTVESAPASADDDGSAGAGDDGSGAPPDGMQALDDSTPEPADAIMLEAPRAATTPNAITAVDHTTHQAVLDLVTGAGTARDVSEERFVTLTDDTVDLRVRFENKPSIDITRRIVMDLGESGPSISPDSAHRVWCTSNHDTIDLADPRCNTVRPVNGEWNEVDKSTGATWSVSIYDETSMQRISCATDGDSASCLLPGHANHAYRIVTSVTNVAELWDGSPLALLANQGLSFLGHTITQPYCWDYVRDSATQNFYCNTRYDYTSAVGLDAATMAFSGIRVAVTANGAAFSTMAAPALAWSYGDEDFPGTTYKLGGMQHDAVTAMPAPLTLSQ